jgi:hypothetical protein
MGTKGGQTNVLNLFMHVILSSLFYTVEYFLHNFQYYTQWCDEFSRTKFKCFIF